MKEFVKDYVDLCKQCGKWYKKHWKGYLVMSSVICGAEVAWFYRDTIKDTIDEKLEERKSK